MMKECYFANYTIGPDAYQSVSEICLCLGKRVLIVGGETALSKAESKLKASMQDFEIVDTVVYGKECFKKRINELYELYSECNIDFIMGVGGGKAIDTSKCLADMLGVKVITIPTIASTCAASSALSVVYNENHAFEGFWYLKSPAYHVFIDTQIINEAPSKYFRAGIGDTLAKYYEVEFSSRNHPKTYNDEMGIAISRVCNTPLINCAPVALNDCKNGNISPEFEQAVLIILITTGMVSMLINPAFNGAVAHALFYGLTEIEGFEEKFLHGDVVGYTTAVQLMLDNKTDESLKILKLLSELGVETSLSQRGIRVNFDVLKPVLESTLKDPDMDLVPYEIRAEMIFDAIVNVENVSGGKQ